MILWNSELCMSTTLIGIDFATQPNKVELACCIHTEGKINLEEVTMGAKNASIEDVVKYWTDQTLSILIAVDAP